MYRQTLLFGRVIMPEANAVFSRSCHNYLGRVRVANPVTAGHIGQVLVQVPMVFHRVDSDSITKSIDDRFNYFTGKVMPEYKKDHMFHTFVFVPSYFDFVKVRNWFAQSDLDFLEVRKWFFAGLSPGFMTPFSHNRFASTPRTRRSPRPGTTSSTARSTSCSTRSGSTSTDASPSRASDT
jgi:hypothetical protein